MKCPLVAHQRLQVVDFMVAISGLEPELFALRGRRVNQLHHIATSKHVRRRKPEPALSHPFRTIAAKARLLKHSPCSAGHSHADIPGSFHLAQPPSPNPYPGERTISARRLQPQVLKRTGRRTLVLPETDSGPDLSYVDRRLCATKYGEGGGCFWYAAQDDPNRRWLYNTLSEPKRRVSPSRSTSRAS